MALSPGTRLGPYEIDALIGVGGMGEVYRATDTSLKRAVAVKVLSSAFASDADRVARFQREAEVLASLNHPNIAAIYGLERTDSTTALVMELVEGPTLADRIAEGPIPIDEALSFAKQIAEALEAAHERGVVHRDLKPANVKVRPDSAVKVLDFGLAKALEPARVMSPGVSQSPTMTSPPTMTGIGALLGTAAYMAPEQARGKPVDKRADIWAFGCVVYEMLTGRQAFAGDSITDALAAVIGAEPDWQALPDSTPLAVRRLVRRCLQKDPSRRLHHIADARIDIEETIAAPSTPPAPDAVAAERRESAWTGRVPWTVAALTALATLVLLISRRTEGPLENREITRLELSMPNGVELMSGATNALAMSPDGRRLAFVGMQNGLRRTFIRRLDELDARAVEGTEGAVSCFFSPDGNMLGIVTNAQQIKTVSLGDGLVSTVATGAEVLSGATWAPGNQIVYVHDGTLWSVPAGSGAARRLTTLDENRREVSHTTPAALPRGNGILFSVQREGGVADVDVVAVATGARRTLAERAESPLYASSGHLVFVRDGDVVAQPFNVDRMTLAGSPVRLPERIQGSAFQEAPLAISETGSLVYLATPQAHNRLVWVSHQGAEEALTLPPGRYLQPRLSPDGRFLAAWRDDELWILDLVRRTFERVPGTERGGYPVWNPDGKRIFFLDFRSKIRWIGINRDVVEGVVVAGTTASDLLSDVSPDGRALAFMRFGRDSSGDIYVADLQEGSQPRPLVKTPAYEGGARFSPDGKWLAYVSDESGRAQVYVRPFPGPDRKWPASTAGGTQPVWSRNGKELYYREGDKLLVVQVSAGIEPSFSQPTPLFQHDYEFGPTIGVANYDVAPDSQKFVMVEQASGSDRLTVVLNWHEELKQRVPVK